MKILFLCNKREPFIKELMKNLQKENMEVLTLQINGFKLYEDEKSFTELNPKTPFDFLQNVPKLKVISKIAKIKKAFRLLDDFEYIILFYNNWTLGFITPSLKQRGKKILSHSLCPKGIDFIETDIKEKDQIYCDIRAVEDTKEFIKEISKFKKESLFVFPMIGESLQRRIAITKMLKNSDINYKIPKGFISQKENISMIASSKAVIALCDPNNSKTIQYALYSKKIPLIYRKFFNFFDQKEFHFVTISNTKELSAVIEKTDDNKEYKDQNRFNVYKYFAWENSIKKCKEILEKI